MNKFKHTIVRKNLSWENNNINYICDNKKCDKPGNYSLFEKENEFQKFLKNKIIKENLTFQEQKCINILGISMPVNINNIKKAYKKLVKLFHPDVNKNNKEAEKKFKEINEAYKILLKKFLKPAVEN